MKTEVMIFQTLCPICGIDIGVSEEDLTIYEITPSNYYKIVDKF